MDDYEVKVYYSPEDECYVAQIVEPIGCATDGPTPEEALANLRELKGIWIRTLTENGYPLPPRYAPLTTPRAARGVSELTAA